MNGANMNMIGVTEVDGCTAAALGRRHNLWCTDRGCRNISALPWMLRTHPPHNNRGKLVTVPKEEHRMQHKTHGCGQGRVRKSKRKREVVKVENGEEHVKDSREEVNSLFGSEADRKN